MGYSRRFASFARAGTLLLVLAAGASIAVGCGRWPEARTYQVESTSDPATSFSAAEEVVRTQNYQVVERDEAARTLKLRTHVDENSETRVTHITVQVHDNGSVVLTPSGYLVRPNGTIHQRLENELASLEQKIGERLASAGSGVAAPEAGSEAAAPPATTEPIIPSAWSEPSSDPAKWGPGNFTCLPVHIPQSDQALIGLRLANGELANLTLSLAYDAALCGSPAACPKPGECPALGIGDEAQVEALARRLAAQEVASVATLLYRGQPAAMVDLSQHGSIAQAMNQASAAPAPGNP